MRTINFKPITINNTDVQTVEGGVLVKNFTDQNKLIDTGLKSLLKDALKYKCKQDAEFEMDLKFSNSQIIVEARFEVEGELDLSPDEGDSFDAVELLHNYLYDAQELVFRPIEEKQYDNVKETIAGRVFPSNLKKINEKFTAAIDVLDVIGVMKFEGKEIVPHLIVDFDYKQKNGIDKQSTTLDAEILSIDVKKKNQFRFKPLGSLTTYKMQTDMATIHSMLKWIDEHFNLEFFARLTFNYETHLKDTYTDCELIDICLELTDEGKQLELTDENVD